MKTIRYGTIHEIGFYLCIMVNANNCDYNPCLLNIGRGLSVFRIMLPLNPSIPLYFFRDAVFLLHWFEAVSVKRSF